jgi:hypothetical protein
MMYDAFFLAWHISNITCKTSKIEMACVKSYNLTRSLFFRVLVFVCLFVFMLLVSFDMEEFKTQIFNLKHLVRNVFHI